MAKKLALFKALKALKFQGFRPFLRVIFRRGEIVVSEKRPENTNFTTRVYGLAIQVIYNMATSIRTSCSVAFIRKRKLGPFKIYKKSQRKEIHRRTADWVYLYLHEVRN